MAQRTEKNPPYGWRFTEKIVDDITELYSLSGTPLRQLVFYGFSGDEQADIIFNNLVDVNGNPITPTFTWSFPTLTITGLGTDRSNSSFIVNFESPDNAQLQTVTNGVSKVINFIGNSDTYYTAVITDYRGY